MAYRSRSRPSSTLGAKASTMRPYYLDGDLTDFDRFPLRRSGLHRSGDTRFSAAAYRWRLMWLLCSFQGPSRGVYAGRRWVLAGALFARLPHHRRTPVSQNSTACWRSLRTRLACAPSSQERSRGLPITPSGHRPASGSVDMLGPNAQSPTGSQGSQGARDLAAVAFGAP